MLVVIGPGIGQRCLVVRFEQVLHLILKKWAGVPKLQPFWSGSNKHSHARPMEAIHSNAVGIPVR